MLATYLFYNVLRGQAYIWKCRVGLNTVGEPALLRFQFGRATIFHFLVEMMCTHLIGMLAAAYATPYTPTVRLRNGVAMPLVACGSGGWKDSTAEDGVKVCVQYSVRPALEGSATYLLPHSTLQFAASCGSATALHVYGWARFLWLEF